MSGKAIDFQALLREERRQRAEMTKKSENSTSSSSSSSSSSCPPSLLAGYQLLDSSDVVLKSLDSEGFRIGDVPSVYYYPNWITEEEQKQLLKDIYDSKWNHHWVHLKTRRLQNLGGSPKPEGLIVEDLPNWANPILDRLLKTEVFPIRPNHILVNEYLPGQGILHHEDGPLYVPNVAIVSLQSSIVMTIKPHPTKVSSSSDSDSDSASSSATSPSSSFSLLLEPRSLLIFREEIYTSHLHGIAPIFADRLDESILNLPLTSMHGSNQETIERGTRVSLTIRRVKKSYEKTKKGI